MLEREVRDFFFKTRMNYNLVVGHREFNVDGLRIDIFAVDKKGNPFIIEFKKDKNRHIVGQSAHYLALIPAKRSEIEKKLNYFNINWTNLKVLCIARAFNQRDFDALKFEPIKNRVFLYEYSIVKDYREKRIFGLELVYKGIKAKSPLYIPHKQSQKLNFKEHFIELNRIEGKEKMRQYYTQHILPFLRIVEDRLAEKYKHLALYPHLTYFGGYVLFRLGLDKKQSHRASISVDFQNDTISSGFDLTHALGDAVRLRSLFQKNGTKLAKKLLTLKDYELYMPNVGVRQAVAIERMDLKGIKLFLENYAPQAMRECYVMIKRNHDELSVSPEDFVNLFDQEYKIFRFLLDEIRGDL